MAKEKTGFNKEYPVTETLEKVIGVKQVSRGDLMKKIWVYIKEKDLQDPSDKRTIVCDDLLKELFQVDRIGMFKMAGALSKHLIN